MKKFCLMLSLLLLGLLFGGCSVFDGQYVRVTPMRCSPARDSRNQQGFGPMQSSAPH